MERDKQIDIMKGILIILVVVGHSGAPFTKFIYLFHMEVFFMISGYLLKDKYADTVSSVGKYILIKIKKIWLPYMIWTIIFLITYNLMIYVHLYPSSTVHFEDQTFTAIAYLSVVNIIKQLIRAVAFACHIQMGGTFWFFKTLFCVSILYVVIRFLLTQMKIKERVANYLQLVLGMIFLIVSYFCSKYGIVGSGIPVIFEVYLFYHIAYMIKKMQIMNRIKRPEAVGIISLAVLLLCFYLNIDVQISSNIYKDPLGLTIASIAGWFFVYEIAALLSGLSWSGMLSYIGKNSVCIMILHFLCFKLVTLIQIYYYQEPLEYLGAFPVLHTSNAWWVVYSIVGVVVPIGLNYLYGKMTKKITMLGSKSMYRSNPL